MATDLQSDDLTTFTITPIILIQYGRRDSNSHAFSSTTPSRWRVCQFRHARILITPVRTAGLEPTYYQYDNLIKGRFTVCCRYAPNLIHFEVGVRFELTEHLRVLLFSRQVQSTELCQPTKLLTPKNNYAEAKRIQLLQRFVIVLMFFKNT